MSKIANKEVEFPKSVDETSISDTIKTYFRELYLGARAMWLAVSAALPYLNGGRSQDIRKEVTEQYPDPVSSRTADDLPPRTRGLLFNDIERCTGCGDCERVCPTHAIRLEAVDLAESAKTWVSVFDIDFARCTFCGLCVESCNPASLIHTKQFEGAVYSKEDLVASFGRGRISVEHLQKMEPRQ